MTTHEDARSDRVDAVVKIDGTSHRSPLSERDLVDRLTHFLVEHQDRESIDSWTVLHKVALHMETDASKRKALQKLQPARGKLPQGDNYAEEADIEDDDHAPSHHSTITSPPSSAPPSQNNKSAIPTPSSHTQSTSLTHDDFNGLSKEERKKRKREAKKHEKEERRSAKKARKEAKKEAKKAKKEAKKAAKKEKRKSG